MRNWAGNYEYQAAKVHHPETVEEVGELVRGAEKVKALGSRHSFNDIADTLGDQICLERMAEVVSLDKSEAAVTVQPGITYGALASYLCSTGFALKNMASLPHISIAGACSTATHGSGVGNACLSESVREMEFVTADGGLMRIARGDPGFEGAVVHLGALGIVVGLTLDVVPTYSIRQRVFLDLPLEVALSSFDKIMASAYSVSLFTDWSGPVVNQIWVKELVGEEEPTLRSELFGARASERAIHPISSMSAESCTDQLGVAGRWDERLPHFRQEFVPSAGDELQSEYLVPRSKAGDALQALDSIREQIAPLLHISEVRSIAADRLWLSPFYRQDSIGIHFTWKKDWERVSALLPLVESTLRPFKPRPHWGKLFRADPNEIEAAYPRWGDFAELRKTMDPGAKFLNGYLRRLFDRE